MTKLIAIASAKGGVGKTTVAINLGTALSNFGTDVVVLDGNLSTPNICLHLGTPQLPLTINDALNGKKHITETAYLHPSGLKVIPASIALGDSKREHLDRLQDVLLDLVGATQVALLDSSSGLGEEAFSTLKAADQIIVVTSPDLPSVTDTLKTVKKAQEFGCKVIGAVVNRVGHKNDLPLKNISTMLELPLLGVIPEDSNVKKSLVAKHPVVYLHPDCPASVGFKKLAANLLGSSYSDHKKEQKTSFWNKLGLK
jgi:septum site-determining protein MinD